MATDQAIPTLYQEVLLTPAVASETTYLDISTNTSTSLFGSSRKRAFDEIGGLDEESYARKHLASEAAIFFRRKEHSPRSILWRLLDNRQSLELQSVDLVQSRQHTKEESCLTYRVALPAPAVQGGVTLADEAGHDALHVFALTTGNELHTITLKRDLLTRDAPPKDFDSASCVHRHHLSSLSFHNPYRFVAVSAIELLISLHDGGLLRLERESTSQSSAWKETFYSEGGWSGTLRGLIPLRRQQTVRYGELELDPSAAVALATSPDKQHIWALSLDHELVVWSTQTGKIVAKRDLLGARRELDNKKATPQYVMPTEQGDLLRIIYDTGDHADADMGNGVVSTQQYQIVAYSPKERAFKLFFARSAGDSTAAPTIMDILDGGKLTLPFDELLNTNLWRCVDYHVKVHPHWHNIQLWVSIQSGASTRLFTISLEILDDQELVGGWEETWRSSWVAVATPAATTAATPEISEDDQQTPSQRWLDFLLYPGRFTRPSLETALQLYRQKRKLQATTAKSLVTQQPLEQRLSTSIATNIPLASAEAERPNYRGYHALLQQQWLGFYSILLELQSRRVEVKSFAFDIENDLAWVVHADSVAPVRTSDKFERLSTNAMLDTNEALYEGIDQTLREAIVSTDEEWDQMKLIAALQDFAAHLPNDFKQALAIKAVQRARSNQADAEVFFTTTDVGHFVTDEAYQGLELALQPLNGIGSLTNELFTSLINIISASGHRGQKLDLALTRYGGKFMIASAQHFVLQEKELLFDLLALVAFLHNDFEAEVLDEQFDAIKLFNDIIHALRYVELRDWLTRNVCLEPSHNQLVQSTIFESLFIGDWDSPAPKMLSFAEKLTHWSRQWAFATFKDWHGFTANVFATLLKHKLYDLASDFEDFLVDSSWTTYLRARLQLSLGEYEEASIGFETAAKSLSGHIKGELDTAGFLTAEELTYFGKGPELYNLHVAALYEKLRLYASVADFAQRALSYIDETSIDKDFEVIDAKKKSTQSPAETVANARAEVQLLKSRTTWEEIVSRRFNALVQTGRYVEAYEALQQFKSPELQRSNLQKLIDSCVKNDVLEVILELPFNDEVADRADAILLKQAKKVMSAGTAMQPAQQILYAIRTRRGDYRAAAQVLYEHLERLRHHGRKRLQDPDDETLLQAYLILINTMACCGEGEDWLLADPIEGVHPPDKRRKLVTLADVRQEYVAELDRRSDLQHGRYPLIGGDEDEMDVL